MGFFSKLKKAANYVTGGAAEVTVEVDPSSMAEPMPIKVTAVVKDDDLEIRGVYVRLKAVETVHVETEDRGTIHVETETFNQEIRISDQEELSANETYEWEGEFEFPEEVFGSYEGPCATHEWAVYAGLDMSGNDPDSNWQGFEIY